jgi:hypothetical protein
MSDIYTASYIATEIQPVIQRLQVDVRDIRETLARIEAIVATINRRMDMTPPGAIDKEG